MLKPAPPINGESEYYWQACQEEKLVYQKCQDCYFVQFYPRFHCKKCGSKQLEYVKSKGTGKINTYSIVHRAPGKAFAEEAPYALALVELDEGFQMMSNILNHDESMKIGDRVVVTFEEREGGMKVPQFQLMLTYDRVEVGKVYGSTSNKYSEEDVRQWEDIYDSPVEDAEINFLPPGFSGIIIMNTYDRALFGRPKGNVHGSQNFKFYRPIPVGESITTTLSVADKYEKKNRKWVVIKTESFNEANDLLFEGEMKILWAE